MVAKRGDEAWSPTHESEQRVGSPFLIEQQEAAQAGKRLRDLEERRKGQGTRGYKSRKGQEIWKKNKNVS